MPRRPRKQPRAFNGSIATKKPPNPLKKNDSKMKKWVRREDIEGDDEDKFHEARDRILLEGDDAGSDDLDEGEEEVFSLGLDDEESTDEIEEEEASENSLEDDHGGASPPRNRQKTKRHAPQSSSESEEYEPWGRSKTAYYASNATFLAGKEGEEDEEEANEMEEREARRLQGRMREGMVDEDFGFGDVTEGPEEDEILGADEPGVASSNPEVHLDKEAVLLELAKTSPETLALAREWDDVAKDLILYQDRMDRIIFKMPDKLSLGLSHLHHQILLTYVTTLAFYLHLRAKVPVRMSGNHSNPRLEAVLARLLTLKEALVTMEDLDFDASDEELSSDVSDIDDMGLADLGYLMGPEERDNGSTSSRKRIGQLAEGELEELLRDAATEVELAERPKKKRKKEKSAGAPLSSNAQKHSSEVRFDLAEPEFVPTAGSATRTMDDGSETYGEVTTLSMTDDADKKARKRTLRFHTNKIEASSRRKEAREKLGGDDDIPYRERNKEKEARMKREVAKERENGGDDLDPEKDMENSIPTETKRKRDDTDDVDEEEGEDGYYELVKRAKKEQKESKKRQYEQVRLAEKYSFDEDESASGPRSLTRAILKNKGLTPRRAKTVRNPRVKKRQQFEKAKKKLGSQKAVFKGGLAGKPYGGEESGITKVVKSIKL